MYVVYTWALRRGTVSPPSLGGGPVGVGRVGLRCCLSAVRKVVLNQTDSLHLRPYAFILVDLVVYHCLPLFGISTKKKRPRSKSAHQFCAKHIHMRQTAPRWYQNTWQVISSRVLWGTIFKKIWWDDMFVCPLRSVLIILVLTLPHQKQPRGISYIHITVLFVNTNDSFRYNCSYRHNCHHNQMLYNFIWHYYLSAFIPQSSL